MERHSGYLSASGLIAEAGQDAIQVNIAIEHSKAVRHLGLVLSSDCQTEDSRPTYVEGKCDWDDPVS